MARLCREAAPLDAWAAELLREGEEAIAAVLEATDARADTLALEASLRNDGTAERLAALVEGARG